MLYSVLFSYIYIIYHISYIYIIYSTLDHIISYYIDRYASYYITSCYLKKYIILYCPSIIYMRYEELGAPQDGDAAKGQGHVIEASKQEIAFKKELKSMASRDVVAHGLVIRRLFRAQAVDAVDEGADHFQGAHLSFKRAGCTQRTANMA